MTHAIRYHKTGGPEVLVWRRCRSASPVRARRASGIRPWGLNFVDIYNRSGIYPVQLPSGLGGEAAGVVEEVGSGVTDIKPGDRVAYGAAPIGAYAEARLIPADRLMKIPEGIDDKTAAAMMLKGLTTQYLIRQTYRVKIRRYHSAACRGRRRRPDPEPVGQASRRHRDRHRRQRRESKTRR